MIEITVKLTLQLAQRRVSAGTFVLDQVVVDQIVQPQCGLYLGLPAGTVQRGELIQDLLIRLANGLGKDLGGFFQLIRAVDVGKQLGCALRHHRFVRHLRHRTLVKYRQLQDLLQGDLVGQILGRLEAGELGAVHLADPKEQRLAVRPRLEVVAVGHVQPLFAKEAGHVTTELLGGGEFDDAGIGIVEAVDPARLSLLGPGRHGVARCIQLHQHGSIAALGGQLGEHGVEGDGVLALPLLLDDVVLDAAQAIVVVGGRRVGMDLRQAAHQLAGIVQLGCRVAIRVVDDRRRGVELLHHAPRQIGLPLALQLLGNQHQLG